MRTMNILSNFLPNYNNKMSPLTTKVKNLTTYIKGTIASVLQLLTEEMRGRGREINDCLLKSS